MNTTTLTRPAPPLDGGAPTGSRRGRRPWLPFAIAFVGYPVLWLAGLGVLAFPLGGAVAGLGLLRRGGPRPQLPLATLPWFAFLLWTVTALVVLREPDRIVAWTYRSTMYLTATALLVWVLGSRRDVLTDRAVLRCISGMWFATIIGGLVAIASPGVEITTFVEKLLPAGLLDIGLIENTVHLQVAAESRFLGFPVGRPEAPYPFTNAWGSNLALLTPLLLATWSLHPTRRWKRITAVMAVAGVVPWIFSLNRGSWISLTIGLVYVGVRRARHADRGRVVRVLVGAVLAVAIGLASPLGTLVLARSEAGHSDEGRASLYTQAIELTTVSPVLGYGAPQPNELDPAGPSIGTHGQLWLLLVSHGVPAALLYGLFFASAYVAALRWRAPHAVWLEACLVIALIQFPIYELLPAQTLIMATVAGLCLRGLREQRAQAALA